MPRLRLVLPAVLLSLAALSNAEPQPQPRFADPARRAKLKAALPRLRPVFERWRESRGVPGLVYGIVIDGELTQVECMGVRDRSAGDPVTPDTLFRIASMTKSFTALAVLKLRDEGKLSLEDPVSRFIPEIGDWKYPTRDTAPLRVRDLLSHSAGFPEDNPWGDRQLDASDETLTKWLRAGVPFSTPPATAYEYSNYGFALAGRVVAKASGMPYDEYIGRNILEPLGMRASTLEPGSAPRERRATGYRKTGDVYSEEPSLNHGAFGAMGGMVTSARDLARYVAFHLSAWPPRDDADPGPVRRSSAREMQKVWRASSLSVSDASSGGVKAGAGGYGFGLNISRDCRFGHIVGHGGGLPGFGSYMMWLPEYGVGMFGMANLTYSSPMPAMNEAFDALLSTGALKPREWPASDALVSMRKAIARLWRHWDDAGAAKIAAGNLFLDSPAAARRDAIAALKARTGECGTIGELRPENWLRGTFRMSCEHGEVDVNFTLAPTAPPTLQYLQFTRVDASRGDRRNLCTPDGK